MSILIWFGIGIGSGVVLWWWRYLVSWMTLTEPDHFDPLHLRHKRWSSRSEPDVGFGFWSGSILTITTPFWLPFYLGHCAKEALKRYSYKTWPLRQSARRTYLSLLRGDE